MNRTDYLYIIDNIYPLEKIINKGGTSKVYLSSFLKDGRMKKVAIKILLENSELYESFLNSEKLAMKSLQNYKSLLEFYSQEDPYQNILELFEVKKGELIDRRKNKKRQIFYIVSEFAEKGELLKFVSSRFEEKFARTIFKKILSAVNTCHLAGFCHRDIKLENFMVTHNYKIKLGDFGFANNINESPKNTAGIGTVHYKAPELLNKKDPYDGIKVDIFSLGIILFALVVGRFPFEKAMITSNNYIDFKEKRYQHFWSKIETCCKTNYSDEFKNLFQLLCSINPKERPQKVDDILYHKWFNLESVSDNELKEELKQREMK